MVGSKREAPYVADRSTREVPEKMGALVTLDYVYQTSPTRTKGWTCTGLGGFPYSLTVYDVGCDYLFSIPTKQDNTDATIHAFNQCYGVQKVDSIYADGAPQFQKLADQRKASFDTCTEGRKTNNAIIENLNGIVQRKTAAVMVAAGAPVCMWPCATDCYANLRNMVIADDTGKSSYYRRWKMHFPGKIIPFGAGIFYKPARSREEFYPPKMNPRMEFGIFLGYHMPPDQPWKGDYLVLNLHELANRSYHRHAKWSLIYTQRTKLVSQPADGVVFPMKVKYVEANRTIEGEEAHKAEMDELIIPAEEVKPIIPIPTAVEQQCQGSLPGTTMCVTTAGDLKCITIHNTNSAQFYLPDADELVEFGGPSRDQIISRITFCHANQTELNGREEIPIKAQGHDEFMGPIPAGPQEITTSLYWHHAPRGVPRPIPQAKTFTKEAYDEWRAKGGKKLPNQMY